VQLSSIKQLIKKCQDANPDLPPEAVKEAILLQFKFFDHVLSLPHLYSGFMFKHIGKVYLDRAKVNGKIKKYIRRTKYSSPKYLAHAQYFLSLREIASNYKYNYKYKYNE
jgi:hypothetical protein